MSELLPDCEKCGLRELSNGPVPDDGGDYSILVAGESPGSEENEQGKPFVGRSGQILRSALAQLGYPEDKVTYTNIVRCHPPDNDTKAKYVRCCYRSLPIQDNTKLVVLCGNVPLKAVLGESGITTWNGVRVERDGIIYAPVLHPAYLLRNQSKKVMDGWLQALDDALYAYDNGAKKRADADYEYIYPETLSDISRMFDDLEKADVIAFDTEFCNLDAFDPDNRILVVSFATDSKAWALPLYHPELSTQEMAEIEECALHRIEYVLQEKEVIGHNIKMDQMQIDAKLGIEFEAAGDTMLASYIVDTTKGIHSLKRLAGYYLGMFEYDSVLQEYVSEHPEADWNRDGSYANVPLDVLLPYAAMDAAATYLLEPLLLDKMTEKQLDLYYELMVPTSNALYRIQRNGMAVDQDVADRYRRLYTTALDHVEDGIYSDPEVIHYSNGSPTDEDRCWLRIII